MDDFEVGHLLASCAAYDNRTPSDAAVLAWRVALDGVSFPEATQAVVAHYRESTDRIMPAHIWQRVKQARAARMAADTDPEPPEADPDDVTAWLNALRDQRLKVAGGKADPRPVRALTAGVFRMPPPPQITSRRPAAQRSAFGVVCPYCAAPPGAPCRVNAAPTPRQLAADKLAARTQAGQAPARRRQTLPEPHHSRVEAAREVS